MVLFIYSFITNNNKFILKKCHIFVKSVNFNLRSVNFLTKKCQLFKNKVSTFLI